MNRSLVSRLIVILVIVGLAAIWAYPPKEQIKLGLDLRGGMHMVLQVNTSDAIRAETDNTIDGIQRDLEEAEITNAVVERTGDLTFDVTGVPQDRDDFLEDEILDRYYVGWSMRRIGDRLQFELSDQEAKNIRELAVNQARETIRNRVDAFGVAEPIIHEEGLGSDRIVVQLPGVDDPDRIRNLIKNTAFLEFRLTQENSGVFATEQQARDSIRGADESLHEVMVEELRDENRQSVGQQYWVLEKRRVITGRDLKTARISSGEFNEPNVSFILTSEGGKKFGDITSNSIGRNLAIVLDNNVISAPVIQARITDQGVITGNFTLQEVQDLVTVLRSGALPAGLTYLEERTVGPTLGLDSIQKGQKAGLIGFTAVILAMLVVYNLSGIIAVMALLLNVVLVFGVLSMFGATLTLPGIAGIVLTIGMAVDANVLIFERIREELRSGRTVKSAVVAGFQKALSSIVDANATTMIAAIFLFMFGTGPIRGFAVTLSVGILASLFTAVFVGRWMFDFKTSRRSRIDKLSI
ncbi:MAG: protein translocase subunit SecD [Acidobacteriota bacterium]